MMAFSSCHNANVRGRLMHNPKKFIPNSKFSVSTIGQPETLAWKKRVSAIGKSQ
jgi:hypothetical protein